MSFPHPEKFQTVPRRKTEETVHDGYKRIKDVYIPTRDGSELCCNVYLPTSTTSQKFPVLLTIGPYGKDIHFAEFGKPETDMYANMAKAITPLGPDACFETPDPIVWCKDHGYAVVRVDVRGSGGSPGVLDPFGLGRSALRKQSNWMDSEVHLPGNPTSYERASSEWKFLEMHTGNHLGAYYEHDQIQRQVKFLDYFLKGKTDNGLKDSPHIDLLIRKGLQNFYRTESAWPPKDTTYTPLYLAPNESLSFEQYKASSQDDAVSYAGLTGTNYFQTEPLKEKLEMLGFPHLDITVSTDAKDMDIFVYFYVIDPQGKKLVFRGNHDEPAVSFIRSWLRLSARTLSSKSTPDRPVLDQMKPAPVEQNKWYDIKVPVVYTSMIIEPGHRLAIALRANNEEEIIPPMRHVGPDRSEAVFSGTNRIMLGGKLVLPIVERS